MATEHDNSQDKTGSTARRQAVANRDTRALVEASLRRRYRTERLFRFYGLVSVLVGLLILVVLFSTIIGNGYGAFRQTAVSLDIHFDPGVLDPEGNADPEVLAMADYPALARAALAERFPDAVGRSARRELLGLLSTGGLYRLRDMVVENPGLIGQTRTVWITADDEVDMFVKAGMPVGGEAGSLRLSERQVAWIRALAEEGRLEQRFNTTFFTGGDSRDPEMAGIWAATKGSFFMLLVTLLLSFPLGVAAAIYLEEFAPRSRWVDLIEVNINNLAAVPSIVFGLLGLAVFINFFGLPRSAPLVGGLVLTLMTLPVVIIASRVAIKAVPPSVREAALGVGASHMQMVTHHVLPLALPGMLTGAIIGMARALGESAPLLMIGMVAFIVDVPSTPVSPSTALPVQIYLWADSPERAFVERTSAAIMVLLAFLLVMNASAVWLRNRFERRW
jgi:phosphate transport system permease protein